MVGPFFLGLAHQSRGFGYGLRAGTSGHYTTGKAYSEISDLTGDSFLLLNSTYHHSLDGKQQSKDFESQNAMIVTVYNIQGYNSLLQLEISLGLYGGIRAGINLAEIADFLIGFTTLDILDDDEPLHPAAE